MAPMEQRTTWTDECLDDLARRMDAGFDRVYRDIHDLRADIQAMNQTMVRMGGGMLIGFISVLAAIAART
jgi:hypothetical protein